MSGNYNDYCNQAKFPTYACSGTFMPHMNIMSYDQIYTGLGVTPNIKFITCTYCYSDYDKNDNCKCPNCGASQELKLKVKNNICGSG